VSSSLFFPLALHPTPLGAFFWLFPVLAALGSVAGPDQARQTQPGMSGIVRHAVFAIGGILPLLALVALALVPLASNTLAFFELWPLAFCTVVALLIGRASGSGASLPIALLALGAALPATALLVLSGYALYYFAPESVRPALGWAHAFVGLTMAVLIASHRRGV